jgi:hypothetical protein
VDELGGADDEAEVFDMLPMTPVLSVSCSGRGGPPTEAEVGLGAGMEVGFEVEGSPLVLEVEVEECSVPMLVRLVSTVGQGKV